MVCVNRQHPVWLIASIGVIALLMACGQAPTPTPTPPPTATATPRPTATPTSATPARPAAIPILASPATPNPVAVTAAYANLAKLDSYHLEIVATGLDKLVPVGIGSKLNYVIDIYKGNQHIIVDDGSGAKQEAYKIDGKNYILVGGQVIETPSLPLIYTLPELFYTTFTAPGTLVFTQGDREQVNGRAVTRYNGTGNLTRLAANPLLAIGLAGAAGDVSGPIWVDTQEGFLVASELTINLTAPQAATAKLRLDTTRVNQVAPITLPR